MKHKHTFAMNAPDAQEVLLAGDFTQWRESAIPLKRRRNGDWEASVRLAPGIYSYRFLVDDTWVDDPTCPTQVPNPFGTQNSVIQVG